MRRATEILRTEHEAILKMLEATTGLCERIERQQAANPDLLNKLIEFFQLFADKCHHGKEEELLFPFLEKKGMPRNGGPIGVMLHEHDQGRKLIGEMRTAAGAVAAGNTAAAMDWARAARQYVNLLNQHISKENNVLFVMAERMLSEAEQQQMAAAFDKIEVEKMGAGTHERLHAAMDEILAAVR